ncbi:NB-ARC domains-containing protein [Tanacetum coccineum]
MAELILTALLPVIFEKLTSVAVNKITRSKEIHSELKKWERSLSHIRSFLEDASQKEVTQAAVKQWLNGLQHLAYDIDDILDALATDAMHHEFTKEPEGMSSKVRKLIPACCTNFSLSTRMDGKLNSITTRLQQLIDEKNNLGLIVKDGGQKNKNRNYQPHPPLLLHVDMQSCVEALVALIDLFYIVLSSTPLKPYLLNFAHDREEWSVQEQLKYRGDSNMHALRVAAVIEEDAYESMTFRDAIACEVIFKWMAAMKKRYGYSVWYVL